MNYYHPGVQRLSVSQHAGDAASFPKNARNREEINDRTHFFKMKLSPCPRSLVHGC